jgi:hypothetical protein
METIRERNLDNGVWFADDDNYDNSPRLVLGIAVTDPVSGILNEPKIAIEIRTPISRTAAFAVGLLLHSL